MRARRSLLTAALAVLFVLALPLAAHAAAVHVSVLGSDAAGDGSMGNPYATVQRGVNAAAPGDDVLVGAGTFVGEITMRNGVSIHGAGSAATTLQGNGTLPVVTANGIGAGTVIEGFKITGGYCASGTWGGGIRCASSSLRIENNLITGNSAEWGGAGIGLSSSPATVKNNVITANGGCQWGAGIFSTWAASTIVGNTISNNSSTNGGGGIFAGGTPPFTITNNTLTNNSAATRGGGIYIASAPGAVFTNNTVANNSAPLGGGVYAENGDPLVANCIASGNGDDLSGCSATYSNIGNGDAGLGNISAASSFVSAGTGDYRLNAGSPCIDVATSTAAPANDRDGVYRPQGVAPDMGAYEWFDAATAAPTDPTLSSDTHPTGVWSNSYDILARLTGASGTVAPIGGYALTVTKDAAATPAHTVTNDADTTTATMTVSSDGTYYLNAATTDVVGNWSAGTAYGPIWIETAAPSSPALNSTTHTINVGSTNRRIALAMTGSTDGNGSGMAGYSVSWTRGASDAPPAVVNVTAESTTSPALLSGEWYAHVRAGDVAGNFSATSQLGPFVLEVPAPDDYTDTTAEDTLLNVGAPGLLSGDANVDDGSLVATLVADAAHGSLSISDDGSFSYMPDTDFNGVDTFTFAAYDGVNVSAARTATITVSPVADVTSIEITSGWKTLSTYGESYSLTGRLLGNGMNGDNPPVDKAAQVARVVDDSMMIGCQVILQSSTSATGFADTSVTTTTGPDGSFAFAVTPRDMTYYRVRFAGETDVHLPATSVYVRVLPVASMGAPTVPTVYAGTAVVASGFLTPRHTAGSKPVRVYKYRRVSGEWKSYGYVLATVSDTAGGSKYKATITLPNAGSWRLAAYNLADSKHAGSWSGYTSVSVQSKGQLAVAIAYQNLGRGYQWGGTGPLVFDSSGFTRYVFAKSGISIPRTAKQQSTTGTYVARKNLKPGDLVFFYSPVSHVGIYVGNGMMIDCNHYGGGVGVRKLYPGYAGARRVW